MPDAEPSTTGAQDTVFLRKASGVMRVMSSRDAMYYGYLAASSIYGLILILLLCAGSFPKANILAANLIAFVLFLAVYVVYANLASAMPRSGGDYVFTSRLLHPSVGYMIAWSCWIIWGFFFVFLAGSAIVAGCISPLFSAIGVATGSHVWTTAADVVLRSYVKIPIILLLILGSTWIMISGMKMYLRIQRLLMMPAALGGLAIILLSYLIWSRNTFFLHFDQFQTKVSGLPAGSVIEKALQLGFGSHHSALVDTLAVAVNLVALYVWTIWSAELLGEIKQANQLKVTFSMFLGAGVLQFITWMIGIWGAYLYFGSRWLQSFAWLVLNHPSELGGSWDYRGVPTLFYMPSLNVGIGIVLFICFAIAISQCLFNPTICSSRLMLAMSFDRVLPEWLGAVNEKGVPYAAIWFCSILGMILTVVIEFESRISAVYFWSGFSALLGMSASLVAGTLFPYTHEAIFAVSPGAQWRVFGVPATTFFGVIACVLGIGSMVVMVADDSFGMLAPGSARFGLISMIASLIIPLVAFWLIRSHRSQQGIEVDHAFKVIPRA